MRTALTIAGSDSSGGAGIQADIKTMMANGVYAMSAVTALTAQNTTGVAGIMNVTPAFLEMELDSVFTDIRPDAVKTGMVSSAPLIRSIVRKLTEYHAVRIVVDPVMVATSGARLIDEDAVSELVHSLIPLADIVTPNIPETEVLSGLSVTDPASMEKAARKIADSCGCAVLVKGGHSAGSADDLLYIPTSYEVKHPNTISIAEQCCEDSQKTSSGNTADRNYAESQPLPEGRAADVCHENPQLLWFRGSRIPSSNTHGTGCTLSSAIAANLARGFSMEKAVRRAKDYISGAIAAGLNLGHGNGPVDHGFDLSGHFFNA